MERSSSAALTLAATSLGFVVVILDVTVVNVALERIKSSLATDVAGLQWVVNSYTLVFASLLLTAGALGDRLGAKRVFIAGFALFTAASLGCSLAPGIVALVAARIVQGVGAALCVPTSLALLNGSFPEPAARARAVGVWVGAGGFAVTAGPVVGGLLVDRFGWPSIFLVNLPLGLLGIWLTAAFTPATPRVPGRGVDLGGQITAILSLAGLTAAFIESGPLGWRHPVVIGGVALCLAAGLMFLRIEARGRDPMLPLSLFRSPTVSAACFVGVTTNFAYYGLTFVLSLYFQVARGYSPLLTGLAFLPMTALVTAINLGAGRLAARFGPRLPMVVGQLVGAVGYAAMMWVASDTPYRIIAVPLLIAGAGVALVIPPMTSAVLSAVRHERSGIASGAINGARQIGGVMGVGLFGSLVGGAAPALIGGMHVAVALAGSALLIGALVSLFGIEPPVRLLSPEAVELEAGPDGLV